jgi:ABC-type transporter MlaC component
LQKAAEIWQKAFPKANSESTDGMSRSDQMKMLTRRNLLAAMAFLGGAAMASRPSLASPEQYVTQLGTTVVKLASSGASKSALRSRFASIVKGNSDVRSIGLQALGPYRKKLPANRQGEFVGLLSTYIAAFFVYYLKEFQGTGIEVRSSAISGGATIVNSVVTKKSGGGTEVRWRVLGGARVGDINVRGVWLTLQLKKRFTDVLKSSGGDFDALFAELKSAQDW